MTRARANPHPVYSARLEGLQVIEASAGTGKTWTISGLYLRLLLEKDAEVGQILAVTFTIAAAAELRDRIRTRIRDMLEAVEGRAGEPDAFIAWMLGRITDRQKGARQLRRALASFDEARISTIHGYCQRALAEHAFGSGVAFQCELQVDTSEILHEVAADFWRLRVADCAAAGAAAEDRKLLADGLRKLKVGVRQLEKFGLTYARRAELQVRRPEAPDLGRDLCAFRTAWLECARLWKTAGPEVRELLVETDLNRTKYRLASVPKWCDELEAFLNAPAAQLPLPEKLVKFTTAEIAGAAKGTPPAHPFFTAADGLLATGARAEASMATTWTLLRLDFIAYARGEIERRLAERNLQSFDDLLVKLSRALEAQGGDALAAQMRARCPYALIDEFQDTDPLQWKIVKAIYGGEPSGTAVFLVGDPKQAIYSFRGADVHAYLAAAAECGKPLPLLENQRSVPGLLDALNGLFAPIDNPFLHEQIRYFEVAAADRGRAALVEAGVADAAPLRVAFLETEQPGKPISKGAGRRWATAVVAGEIVRLLGEGRAGRITLGARPLRAGDIAVLVNTNDQAAQVRQALAGRGVSSAEMSTLSVFASDEAEQLQRVLQAMSTPRDSGGIRAALATDLIGLGADELVALEDDRKWEAVLGDFARYHDIWNRAGVMRALRELFRERQTYARLARFRNGERRLTNLYHLGELLNLQEQHLHGIESLIAWLAARRGTLPAEDMQLRLDSDANLVQIVTIHRSKGLEYPVTFVPFLWDGGSHVQDDLVTWHGEAPPYPMILDAREPGAHQAQARAEELGERRRVAYVGLTRARNRCYLLSGDFNQIGESALGGVLDQPQALERLCKSAVGAVLAFRPQPGGAMLAPDPASATLAVRTPCRTPPMGFAETSFSALARGAEAQDESAPAKDHDQEVTPAPQRPAEAPGIRETFPAGPRAGNCLHEILDKAGAARGGWEEGIRRELKRAGYDEKLAPQVGAWLQEALATPLPAHAGAGVRLIDVQAASQMKELEFQLAAPRFSPAQLVQIVRRHGIPIPDLRVPDMRGYLSGAIDLTYRHEQRWYVADYKSNRLESTGQGYALAAMEEAMAGHNYHLQYLIYTVALHRWLRSWLSGYDYDRHVGGVRYLFLRGMHPEWKDEQGGARGVFACRPPRALIEALDDCFGLPATQGRAA